MDVTVSFTWTPAEFVELLDARALARPGWRWLRRLAPLLPLGVLGAAAVAAWRSAASLAEVAMTALPWLLLTLIWWFLASRVSLSLPIYRRSIGAGPEDREFTERGFRADGPITSALVEWSAVTRVEERAGLLLVYVGIEVHGTPLRALSKEQRAAVRDLTGRRLGRELPGPS